MTLFSPTRLVHIAIAPRHGCDLPALTEALTSLAAGGSSFDAAIDEETGHIVLADESEDQVDAAVAFLRVRHGLDLNVGSPHIAYRETFPPRLRCGSPEAQPRPR